MSAAVSRLKDKLQVILTEFKLPGHGQDLTRVLQSLHEPQTRADRMAGVGATKKLRTELESLRTEISRIRSLRTDQEVLNHGSRKTETRDSDSPSRDQEVLRREPLTTRLNRLRSLRTDLEALHRVLNKAETKE